MTDRRAVLVAAAAATIALVAAGTGLALQKPGRVVERGGPIQLVALNQGSYAFVVGRSQRDCDHVELWDVGSRGLWRFGRPGPCTDLGSTGTGISALGVSGNRALWARYTGGNLRDWELMTATTTSRLPRRLRFVEQDVELPSPFAIGDSTGGMGIPYAAGREVVLLGTNGAAVLRHRDPAKVVRVAAGSGPGGVVVAALRETGDVALLRRDGSVAWTAAYPAGAVTAVALAPVGLLAQVGDTVEIRRQPGAPTTVALPHGARMTDYAEGRILYVLGREVRSRKVATGTDTVLLAGPAGTPPPASQDAHGLAWGRGKAAAFACAACVAYAQG
jgi:hypothetical protein